MPSPLLERAERAARVSWCKAGRGITRPRGAFLIEASESNQADISARLGRTEACIFACRHSRQPRIVHLPDGVAVVNPGSVGLPDYADDGAHPHVSETGSPLARYALLELSATQPRIPFDAVEYDHTRAAHQATAKDRPDRALALRTGYAVGG